MTKEREAYLLGKSEGLAIARIEFAKLESGWAANQFIFYKSLDSEIAKIQIELETEKNSLTNV